MTFCQPLQHICYAIKITDMIILIFQSFYVFEGIFFIYWDKRTFCEQDFSHVDTKILVNLHNTIFVFLEIEVFGGVWDFFHTYKAEV